PTVDRSRLSRAVTRLSGTRLAPFVAYAVLPCAATALLVELVPRAGHLVSGGVQEPPADVSAGIRSALEGQIPVLDARTGLPVSEVFAMAAAFALMLPVTWIYIMTRRRKGFRQSVG